MSEKKQLPNFQSEAEQAQWWYFTREARAEEFAQAIRDGRATKSTLAARVAASHETIKVSPEDVSIARDLAGRLGLKYQPFVERVFHEALERELNQAR